MSNCLSQNPDGGLPRPGKIERPNDFGACSKTGTMAGWRSRVYNLSVLIPACLAFVGCSCEAPAPPPEVEEEAKSPEAADAAIQEIEGFDPDALEGSEVDPGEALPGSDRGPKEKKPVDEKPVDEKPVDEKPVDEKPEGEKEPSGSKPSGDGSSGSEPSGDGQENVDSSAPEGE